MTIRRVAEYIGSLAEYHGVWFLVESDVDFAGRYCLTEQVPASYDGQPIVLRNVRPQSIDWGNAFCSADLEGR